MSDWKKGPPSHRPLAEGQGETLYKALGGVLQGLLTRKFAIPEDDAQRLVYEVFMAFSGLNPAPPDARGWVIGGACCSAITYLERRGLSAGSDTKQETRALEQMLLHVEALALLPGLDRQVLRMRFEEGKTVPEIAAKLGVSPRSAKWIVSRARRRLRRLMRSR